ncbi:DNA helicase [Escherichia phage Bp7]|uniref:DNA helicase n=1 Tax=Escherichia phage Bp7 TaxID=1052121 RepID=G3MUG9_9CAUD|nr:Dda-like helicase [Escherichia phage Bp7]AEN93839.1 DNA helicase [Escherichia phage Bp7]
MITFEDLNNGQRTAFKEIIEAIKRRKGEWITLNGPAGTGKTTLTKFILDHLVKNGELGVILTAPTHAAKKVLSKLAGQEASTIHRILKINPTTYEDQDIFEQREAPDLSKCNVLVVDEGSMIDGKLFKIIESSVPPWCTVLGIGDRAQLQPVEPGCDGSPQLSPFFTHPKIKQLHLTEVMRSNAPIIEVATEIRNGGWFRDCIFEDHGVHGFKSQTALKDFMMNYFSIVKDADALFENRMFAYTNKSVEKLNSIIRKKLYETDAPYIKGEILVMQEPFMKELEYDGKKFSETIFNNGQMVRILDVNHTSLFLSAKDVGTRQMINYWDLQVESVDEDDEYYVEHLKVIDETSVEKFHYFLAKVATEYKAMRGSGKKPKWADFWKAKRMFSKVRALPVSTVHKSQGLTVQNSFIYTPCMHMADANLASQLAYVSITRARTDAYYV